MAKSLLKGIIYHTKRGTLVSRVKRELRPRVLAPAPVRLDSTHSAARLNALHAGMPACSTYLEVGVEFGRTFENIAVPFRSGCRPAPTVHRTQASRRGALLVAGVRPVLRAAPAQQLFDLVFLDGLHEWQQTYRDLMGALMHTPPHGIIVIDDVVPDDEWAAMPDHILALEKKHEAGIHDLRWQGDVFKVMWCSTSTTLNSSSGLSRALIRRRSCGDVRADRCTTSRLALGPRSGFWPGHLQRRLRRR